MDHIIQIFKALSDETRLKILIMVSKRRICAKGIAKHLCISEAAVSQHLKILKETGIISSEKMGYYVLYTLQEQSLEKIKDFIEHMIGSENSNDYAINFYIPGGCACGCKGSKNKCCQNNNS